MDSPDDVSMLLDDQLCFALYSATHSIQRLYRPLLNEVGLTYPQYLVLLVLWEDDGLAVSDIGARLSLNSATLTPLLKRMQSAGLISRARSTEDERRMMVSLTSKGRDLQLSVRSITNDVTCAASTAADDAEALRDLLMDLRDRLAAQVDDEPGPAPTAG